MLWHLNGWIKQQIPLHLLSSEASTRPQKRQPLNGGVTATVRASGIATGGEVTGEQLARTCEQRWSVKFMTIKGKGSVIEGLIM